MGGSLIGGVIEVPTARRWLAGAVLIVVVAVASIANIASSAAVSERPFVDTAVLSAVSKERPRGVALPHLDAKNAADLGKAGKRQRASRGPTQVSVSSSTGAAAEDSSWSAWIDGWLGRNWSNIAWAIGLLLAVLVLYLLRWLYKRSKARLAFDPEAGSADDALVRDVVAYLQELRETTTTEVNLDVIVGPDSGTPFPDLSKLDERAGVVAATARWFFQPSVYTVQVRLLSDGERNHRYVLVLRDPSGAGKDGTTIVIDALPGEAPSGLLIDR